LIYAKICGYCNATFLCVSIYPSH